jgi:hypothetical protein
MTTLAEHAPLAAASRFSGEIALKAAVRLWFAVTFAGQLIFVTHIVSFYGRTAVAGDFARWSKFLAVGWVPGDSTGNAVLATHLMMAALVTLGGLLQLLPRIRSRFPAFHRWTGRTYIATAFIASGSALYLLLIRGGTVGGFFEHLGIFVNALLIMLFAALALRFAMARRFEVHRRWALRLFLVVSGVWFFRVGLFFWLLVNRGPVGFNPETFQGPAIVVLSFAQYLLPLAVLELYLRARERGGPVRRLAVAGVLLVLTLVTGIGIFGYTASQVSGGNLF